MGRKIQKDFLYPCIAIGMLYVFTCSTDVWASSVSAFSNNQGSFSIQANALNKMTSAEIYINYQVTDQNENAQIALYPNLNYTLTQYSGPGYLDFKIAYIEKVYTKKNPNGAPNPLLRLSGDYKLLAIARIPGDITSLSATICSDNAGCESLQGTVTNSTNTKKDDMKDPADTTENPEKDTPAAKTSGNRPSTYPDPAIQNGTPTSERSSIPSIGGAVNRTPGDKSAHGGFDHSADADDMMLPIKFSQRKSLMERFISITGEKTISTLAGLLMSARSDVFQEPPLLLADGIASLILTVRGSGKNVQASQFYISGGHCANLQPSENGSWILEIVPERGSLKAAVTVLAGREAIEYPLSIVPPLDLFDMSGANADQIEFVRIANEFTRAGASK